MNKKVKIIDSKDPSQFKSVEEYLLHTYGKKKLEQSKRNSNYTYLDVIGYTLDECGYETVEGQYYELEEIEEMMFNKWDDEENENE